MELLVLEENSVSLARTITVSNNCGFKNMFILGQCLRCTYPMKKNISLDKFN